jgi:hypothetical protein
MNEYKPLPKGAKLIGLEIEKGVKDPNEIAKNTGYTLGTVRYYMSIYFPSHRIRTDTYKYRLVSEKTKQIIEDLMAGDGQSNIARKFGVSRQRVAWVKKKYLGDTEMKNNVCATDEEIAKAILQQIEYDAGVPYINEWKQVKTIKFTEIINFIHRLQGEKNLAGRAGETYKTIMDGQNKMLDEQKEEIENMQAVIFGLEEETRQLQKQVDELGQANIDLWNANQFGVKYAKNPYKGVEVE